MKVALKAICVALFSVVCTLAADAQTRNRQYEEYIHKYQDLAVKQMRRFHIPASITLAQGLLESGAGRSTLARKSNNHFGIKCGGDWTGKSVRHDDDARDECFRAYKHPEDSYEDHSKFLCNRLRYASLFKLKITDYKGWARGLKKAGYATDPKYADRLINIIELYQLYNFDSKNGAKWMKEFPNPHQPYLANDLLYVIAREGDTFKGISKEFDVSQKKLRKYNDLFKGYGLQEGDIIYLDEKHPYSIGEHAQHVVRRGESMYSISQKYGIRLKNLYKMNPEVSKYSGLQVGDILLLR